MPRYLVQEVIYEDHFVIADDEDAAFTYVNRSTPNEVLVPELLMDDEYPDEVWEEV